MKTRQRLSRLNIPTHAGPNLRRHMQKRQFAQVVRERDRWRERYDRATPILGVIILVCAAFIGGYIVGRL